LVQEVRKYDIEFHNYVPPPVVKSHGGERVVIKDGHPFSFHHVLSLWRNNLIDNNLDYLIVNSLELNWFTVEGLLKGNSVHVDEVFTYSAEEGVGDFYDLDY